jgi:hypothetical protein
MTTDEHDELAVVVRVPTEFEAHTIAAILHESGIEATVAPGAPTWTGQIALGATDQGSAVVVRSDDLRRARTVLDESDRDSVDLDWDEVDVGDREDNLPLTPVGRMPIPAKIAAALAAAILIVTAMLGFLLLVL